MTPIATPIVARDIMTTRLITLTKQMDVLDAIGMLLKHKISGAPVVDAHGNYLGVFSEKCCMTFLLAAAYDGHPRTEVEAFMDTEPRTIDEETDLLSIAQIFQETNLRRLAVLSSDGKLVGQISRRDVLRAAHNAMKVAGGKEKVLLYLSSLVEHGNAPIS